MVEISEEIIEKVKERLDNYLEMEKEIDKQIERLEYLSSKMTGVSAQALTGMPRSGSASTDRMADMLGAKEELELSIRNMVSKQSQERREIEKIIQCTCKVDERAVIRMRYFDRLEWDEVLDVMFGSKDDFLDREESYRRRMFKARKTAIRHIAKYVQEAGNTNTAISAT